MDDYQQNTRDPNIEHMLSADRQQPQQYAQFGAYNDQRVRQNTRIPSNQLQGLPNQFASQQVQYQQYQQSPYQVPLQIRTQPQQQYQQVYPPYQQMYGQQQQPQQFVPVPQSRFIRSTDPSTPIRNKSPVNTLRPSPSSVRLKDGVPNQRSDELVFEEKEKEKEKKHSNYALSNYSLFKKTAKPAKATEVPKTDKSIYKHVNGSDDNLNLMPTIARGFENSISKTLQKTNGELRITGDGYYITEEPQQKLQAFEQYYEQHYGDQRDQYQQQQLLLQQQQQLQQLRQLQQQQQQQLQQQQLQQQLYNQSLKQVQPKPQPKIHESYLRDPSPPRVNTEIGENKSNEKKIISAGAILEESKEQAPKTSQEIRRDALFEDPVEIIEDKRDDLNGLKKRKKGGLLNVFKFDRKKKDKKEKELNQPELSMVPQADQSLEDIEKDDEDEESDEPKPQSPSQRTEEEIPSPYIIEPPEIIQLKKESSEESMRSIKTNTSKLSALRRNLDQAFSPQRLFHKSSPSQEIVSNEGFPTERAIPMEESDRSGIYEDYSYSTGDSPSNNGDAYSYGQEESYNDDDSYEQEDDSEETQSEDDELEDGGALVGLIQAIPIFGPMFNIIDQSSLSLQTKLLVKMVIIIMVLYEIQTIYEVVIGWFSSAPEVELL